MATYPSGVTTFIPDYQPYQPDLNFTANVLQLKQTQYDQNWSRLNNIYGQLLNAPLTHDQSREKRDNTFKRIDFDLRRVTGLDLSLEQNVQQATQLFRPFYEDASLMKDMAWTKNTSFEKSLGEGKRYNTDEKVNSEYWDGGLRAIDYKVQEFKALPYEQLPSFGDVKYTPYVNVEKQALDLANEMKIDIKRTTPNGDWIVTEKNGDQVIEPLQSTFYATLGKDPKVREFYATRAYLERKDYVESNKDKPEYGGNAELAEKEYLNRTLNVMKNQSLLTKTDLLGRKQANEKMITKLEKSIADGTDIETTESALLRYRQANEKIAEMLKQNEDDYKMLEGDVNRTLTSEGGTKLSTDDIEVLRSRVDAVTGSNMLQADINNAAENWAKLHGEVTYDPNPFSVQRQKYMYDSSLIQQRAAAQKDVAYYKYQLDMDKATYEAKAKSGLYDVDPKSGKLKMKPELSEVQAMADMMAKTDETDPQKLTTTVNELYNADAESAKTTIVSILNELRQEGTISNSEILEIMSDKQFSGFNMKPMLKWLKENGKSPKGTKTDTKMLNMMMEEGTYTTSLEKEMAIDGDAGFEEGQSKLQAMARGSLDDVSPDQITRMTKRLINVIDKKKDDPSIRNSKNVKKLVTLSHNLDDYAAYRREYFKNREKIANQVAFNLKADGFNYAKQLFDDELNFVDKKTFIANVARDYPDDIILNNGMSWGGFWNSMQLYSTAGAGIGAIGGPGGVAAGGLIGAVGSAIVYPIVGLGEMAVNALFDNEDSTELARANSSTWGSQYSTTEEYEAMMEEYENMVMDSRLNTEVLALNHPIEKSQLSTWNKFTNMLNLTEQGTGLYTANGAGITVEPGIMSPTYEHFLEIKKVLRNLDVNRDDGVTYVSFDGVDTKFDEISDPVENNKAWAAIWADLNPKTNKKSDELKRFMVGVSPFGGEDAGKAAIQFRLPVEYLKKFKPDSDGNGPLDQTTYDDLLQNGVTIITDARNLAGVSMFRNSYKTPEQIRIEKAGAEGVTYTDPTLPGISLNYKLNPVDPSKIIVTTSYNQYMGPDQPPKKIDLVSSLSNQGANLKLNREKFFTGDESNQDIDGPKIQQIMNNDRRQYGGK